MPILAAAVIIAVLAGAVVVAAGRTGDEVVTVGPGPDGQRGTWTILPDAPLTGRADAVTIATENEMIFWGGLGDEWYDDGAAYSATAEDGGLRVDALDPDTGTWENRLETSVPEAGGDRSTDPTVVVRNRAGDQRSFFPVLRGDPEARRAAVAAELAELGLERWAARYAVPLEWCQRPAPADRWPDGGRWDEPVDDDSPR